jgi:NADPH:quinone reductase-like Zn-dependent oxidoreductase
MASIPKTMKAWQWTACPETLEKALFINESADLPTAKKPLGPDEVLVKVHYAALNPVDYKLPELPVVGRMAIPKPATPGLDFSGVVADKGPESTLQIGQKVFGKVEPKQPHGTLADYIVGSKEGVVPVPDGVSLEDAACVGVCGLVTYQCLKAQGIKAGDKVFLNGGSGGAGTFAIQIAKALGAEVTTTTSTVNVELCKNLGADTVIDYTSKSETAIEALKKSGKQYDAVLDNVGFPPELYWESPHFTKESAPYTQIGTQVSLPFVWDLAFRLLLPTWLGGGQRKFGFAFTRTNAEDYKQLVQWMVEGKLKSEIEKIYRWEEVPDAFVRCKSGRVRGKLVIKVN